MKLLWSEKILVLAGLGILASVPLIAFLGVFDIWLGAKVSYAKRKTKNGLPQFHYGAFR